MKLAFEVNLLKAYSRLFQSLSWYLQKELRNCRTVLDIGCGSNSPLRNCRFKYSVGIDLFKQSLMKSKQLTIHSDYLLANILQLGFKNKCVDAVAALDIIEHLAKHDAFQLIEQMEMWARKKIVILVPNCFIHQDICEGSTLQEHKSGWNCAEMTSLGFKVRGLHGLWFLRGEMAELKYKPKVFSKIISDCSQKVTYYTPCYAYHLLCVKELS